MTLAVAKATVFQEIRPGDGFITSDFAEELLGGLPHLERLFGKELHCYRMKNRMSYSFAYKKDVDIYFHASSRHETFYI